MQNTAFSTNYTLNFRGKLVNLGTPKVMGVLNITPDSFYSGSRVNEETDILNIAEQMLREGADFLDIGGYSSRPGAQDLPEKEEMERVTKAITSIIREFPDTIISVDTFRSQVAQSAIEHGAHMINDISGGELDTQMFDTVAALGVPYILMHMRGTPKTMTSLTSYNNLIKDLVDYFHAKVYRLRQLNVKDIIIDPGFGFAKTREQNFEILQNMSSFKILGLPLLAGLSRKSMIWKTLDIKPEEALNGTTMLNTIALMSGANILRVHDVKEASEVVKLFTVFKHSANGKTPLTNSENLTA